ncbi:hypothetical protein QEZ48_21030 [Aquamicrobium lusatiense]|uniref:hypothetical protein n=1 Tax=Aquamicrobium lusatiense TaxID=89772 RepID=UPI0024569580|nr:hypothetical protein [Aquamicrobium lusatiense]MDH4993297.1 hypothetical protein [Aquamicrobium lusatiense]
MVTKVSTPAANPPKGDRPDDVLDEARDLLKTVRMALMSDYFDASECITLSAVMGKAIVNLDRVHAVLSEGVSSTWDPATPKGKMVIPEIAA